MGIPNLALHVSIAGNQRVSRGGDDEVGVGKRKAKEEVFALLLVYHN
jgi:hypothetical protein